MTLHVSFNTYLLFVPNTMHLEKGIVLKSTGSNYKVLRDDGVITNCSVKGKLRIKELRTTNPIAVGDNVLFEIDDKTGFRYYY